MLSSVLQDVRFAGRQMRRSPAFVLSAILTLALGIGAATTIFSVIQNVLLDPFPYTDADRVVGNPDPRRHQSAAVWPAALQTPEFLDYVEQNHVFEDVIGGTSKTC